MNFAIRIIAVLLSSVAASTALAHPGHRTLSAHHVHSESGLDPTSLILFAAAISGVILIVRIGKRASRGQTHKHP